MLMCYAWTQVPEHGSKMPEQTGEPGRITPLGRLGTVFGSDSSGPKVEHLTAKNHLLHKTDYNLLS